jgi:DNA-binding winged helix-turn-helix (wHTH) protein/predicted ATPase
MGDGQRLSFGPFCLDMATACLLRGAEPVPLTAKAYAVLCYLVEHTGQLVTRDTLLEAVWKTMYVSDAALASCIRDLRRALGETAQTPQFLETVRGRGFRFLAPVNTAPVLLPAVPADPHPPLLVGRDPELAQLHRCFATALQGQRQFVFITGEAGIGKTTLVDAFVAQTACADTLWIGHGQCIDHHGASEAYLPLLAALGHLGYAPDGSRLVEVLRQYAPSWLLHLPSLTSATEVETLQRRAGGTTRERMLRELAEAAEVLSAERPLVLVLEDLHWSDAATLDWLAYVARRRVAARLLVLGTYRSAEAMARTHPVHPVAQDLKIRGQCTELPLGYLSDAEVTAYLTQRGAGVPVPTELAGMLHRRTTGNPLFLVTIVDALARQGLLQAGVAGWVLTGGIAALTAGVPESLRQLITQQLEQLAPTDQAILEVASVAGKEFAVAAVAASMERATEDVEAQCASLARRGQFVRVCGTDAWPDGTVAMRYCFLHDLYRETLYARVPVGQRARWHQQIGLCLEAGYSEHTGALAVELAEHFRRGYDFPRAVQYLWSAGEQALQRNAYQEAITALTTGLELLGTLPDTPERLQQKITFLITLAVPFLATQGYGSATVERLYLQARALSQQAGESSHLFTVLRGLWNYYLDRAELHPERGLRSLAEQLLSLARHQHDSQRLVEAHRALGTTLFFMGHLPAAREHFEQGIILYDGQPQSAAAFLHGADPGVLCRIYVAWTLWMLGYADQALQRMDEALALAQGHPFSLAFALPFSAWLHLFRREWHAAHIQAEAVIALATEQGFPQWVALGMLARGGALCGQGQYAEGSRQLQQGLAAWQAQGLSLGQPRYLTMLAEAYGEVRQADAGLQVLDEALALLESTGERVYEADLYRLRGELLLRGTAPDMSQAETCWRHALNVARAQQARSWELRAALSLCRLWQQQGKQAAAYALLAPLYGWFTEGFDTTDLQEARAVLETLDGSAEGGRSSGALRRG